MERMDPRQGTSPGSILAGDDALGALIADHERVTQLFDQFEESEPPMKAALARQICQELKVHAQVEEEFFYPAARDAIEDVELIDEALEEHSEAKQLIARIEASGADPEALENLVLQLRDAIDHHVEEEESEVFPQVRASGIDLVQLGVQLVERKRQLKTSGL